MNESEHPPAPPRRTSAITRKTRWPGWIWAVPIAALGIVAWLLIRAFSVRGVDVTVTFDDAAGMKARDTKVTYHGLEVGKVTSVELTPDRKRVLAHLNIDKRAQDDLTTGARFYLQGAQVSFSDPASLKAILAGPSILMVAGTGPSSRRFAGLLGEPPDRFSETLPYLVKFDGDVGRLRKDASVTLRGFTVGKVTSFALATEARTGEIVTSVVLGLDPTRFNIKDMTPERHRRRAGVDSHAREARGARSSRKPDRGAAVGRQ